MKNTDFPNAPARARCWSNRLLIVSLLGIAYFTLFPFQFHFAPRPGLHGSPLLLGNANLNKPNLEFFLNVLLFIPFGFGLSAELRKRGRGRSSWLWASLIAGLILSYLVELLQLYTPSRNSGWNDLVSNSIGSVLGMFAFVLFGDLVLKFLSRTERDLENWLTLVRTGVLLVIFLGFWLGLSIPLQRQSRLKNWDMESALFVGNDASGHHFWKGKVFSLEIWNRSLREEQLVRLTSGDGRPTTSASLAASYDFTSSAPFGDHTGSLPPLIPVPMTPEEIEPGAELDGSSWLTTKTSVAELSRKIQDTGQFTLHLTCVPAEVRRADERIISISRSTDVINLHLRQEGTNLVVWFRNPISETRSSMAWYVPAIFHAGEMRNIAVTYDGADAAVYVDGKKVSSSYRLGPGVSLIHEFFVVTSNYLNGYIVAYEILLFFSTGLLIGIAARKRRNRDFSVWLMLAAGLILPPILLETVLVSVSGRGILPGNICISVLIGIAGVALISADSPENAVVD